MSKRSFAALDAHMWRLVHKWASFTHPNKPVRWVTAQYFGMFNPARRDKWVFGNQKNGFYLRKFAWTPIIRHRMVAATASPDDPSLTDYWAKGVAAAHPRSAPAHCGSCSYSTAGARSAEGCCYTPTMSRKAHASGNNGALRLERWGVGDDTLVGLGLM